jgi:hypothetical protein
MTPTQQGLTFCFQYNDPVTQKPRKKSKRMKKAGKVPPQKKNKNKKFS